jgi:uncharacterized protein Usg
MTQVTKLIILYNLFHEPVVLLTYLIQTVELSFDRAVKPGIAIDIDLELNYVGIWGLERYYDLAAKFVSSDRYIDFGRTDLRRS